MRKTAISVIIRQVRRVHAWTERFFQSQPVPSPGGASKPAWLCLTFVLFLGACVIPVDLSYDPDPDNLVIYANQKTWPIPLHSGEVCNLIPNLRVWGDGRVVRTRLRDGVREVLAGSIGEEEIHAMLATLQSHGYFERHAGSASGRIRKYSVIEVRLTNRHRRVLWVETPPVFEALLEHTEAYGLSPFHPREGFLTASRRFTALSMDEPEQWPDVFGFSLRELDSGGRWVSGAALAYVWPLVNERGVPTVVREGESVRALGLQIPGVSAVEPPRDCWETGYSP